jgi:AcrR family transcriptional regulator
MNARGGKRGRPRSFDADVALDQALEVFWRKGYEGASLQDLTEAMGINRPSLYGAFGNKEELYRKVLDRYAARSLDVRAALEEGTAREVARRYLALAADAVTDRRHPKGCLIVQGVSSGDQGEPIRQELCSRRAASEAELRRRFERARKEGDLPKGASPAGLAAFLVTVVHGMSVQAAAGASRATLHKVAEMALRAWPQ